MIVPILVLVIALSTIFYMANYFNQDKKKIVLAKGLTSLQFVILGVYCATLKGFKSDKIMLILVGLFCGLIGDILFGLKYIFIDRKKELYIGGILFFFTGHIAYILSFFEEKNEIITMILLSFALFVITTLILEKSGVNFGSVRIFSYVYILCCAFLICVVGANVWPLHEKRSVITFVGVSSFLISDTLLSYLYFKEMNEGIYRKIKMVNILTYYIGQTLIALSIYFII